MHGASTPAQIGTPATAWWPLGGIANANPTTSDTGIKDATGNGYNFTTITGPSTNAYYAPPIPYAGPTVTAYVAKSGSVVYFFAIDTMGLLSVISAINNNPTISVNGSPVTAEGPFWTNSSKNTPFVCYQIPTVTSGQTVTYTASFAWFTCGAGSASTATNAPIANYVGQLEPGVGSLALNGPIPGFGIPTNPTLGLGFCNSWPGGQNPGEIFTLFRNWLKRGTWTNVIQKDSYGHPQIISATSACEPVDIGQQNYVDGLGVPIPTGNWAFVYDETAPATPMTVSASIYGPGYGSLSVTGPLGGTLVESVLVGRYYLFDVQYTSSTPSSYEILITVSVSGTGTGGSGNWTIQNERLVQPGDSLSTTDPYTTAYGTASPGTAVPGTFALNSTVKGWLTTPNGNGPSMLRSTGLDSTFDGVCSAVDADDLAGPYEFSYDNSARNISCSSIRPYVVGSGNSQYVWLTYPWSGASAVAGGPAPYAIAPSSINYLNFSGTNTDWFVGEIVTAAGTTSRRATSSRSITAIGTLSLWLTGRRPR